MAAGNNLTQQISNNGVNNIQWSQVGVSAVFGAGTAYVGGMLGSGVNSLLGPTLNCLTQNIASPVLRNLITNSISNSLGGGLTGTVLSIAQGNSIGAALGDGVDGLKWGFTFGSISGVSMGFREARLRNANPWTGASKIEYIAPLDGVGLQTYDLSGRQIFEIKKANIDWNDRVISAKDRFHKLNSDAIPDKLYMTPRMNGDGKNMHLMWEGPKFNLPSSKGGAYYGNYEIIYSDENGWNHFMYRVIYKK